MIGYVGERARRRKRKLIYLLILVILSIILLYYYNYESLEEIKTNEEIFNNDNIEVQKNYLSLEDYELKIIEKDQKILFRENKIITQRKKINSLLVENKKI